MSAFAAMAHGHHRATTRWLEPARAGPEVHVIGDARGQGGLAAAFTEAAEVAGRIQ